MTSCYRGYTAAGLYFAFSLGRVVCFFPKTITHPAPGLATEYPKKARFSFWIGSDSLLENHWRRITRFSASKYLFVIPLQLIRFSVCFYCILLYTQIILGRRAITSALDSSTKVIRLTVLSFSLSYSSEKWSETDYQKRTFKKSSRTAEGIRATPERAWLSASKYEKNRKRNADIRCCTHVRRTPWHSAM